MVSIYLETSVVGAYLDRGESFRRDLTMRWWEHEMKNFRAFVSPLVTRELERTREPYRRSYLAAERTFLDLVNEHTARERVSIFIDNIGGPVLRATMYALGRQGVLTTSGWKHGTDGIAELQLACVPLRSEQNSDQEPLPASARGKL